MLLGGGHVGMTTLAKVVTALVVVVVVVVDSVDDVELQERERNDSNPISPGDIWSYCLQIKYTLIRQRLQELFD